MRSHSFSTARVTRALLCILFVTLLAGVACSKTTPEETAPAAASAAGDAPSSGEAASNAEDTTPLLEWDQERMTKLTADLATAMRDVRNSFRKNPMMQTPDSTMRRSANQMTETLRGLDRHTASLASRVANGQNADETRGIARQIGTLLRDANSTGRRLMTSAWTDERILPAMKLINEIAPYYGSKPLYDTETMTMIEGGPNPNRRESGE